MRSRDDHCNSSANPEIHPWERLSSRVILDLRPWFRVLEDSIRLPGGRVIDDYYRIEAPDYVIMAVCDQEGRFLLERMYRHPVGSIILTSPSGGVEAGETPLAAAKRELLEETGFTANEWSAAGQFLVDGTRGICKAHFFLARDLSREASPRHQDIETCAVEFLTRDEIAAAIRNGGICLLPDIALFSLVLGPFLSAVEEELS